MGALQRLALRASDQVRWRAVVRHTVARPEVHAGGSKTGRKRVRDIVAGIGIPGI